MSTQAHHPPLKGNALAAFIVVTLVWGSTWLVIRDQISQVPASWGVTWRFVAATIGMFVLATVRNDGFRLSAGGAKLAIAVGFTQFFANFQLVYRAEQHLTSGIVAVLYALLMVPNAVLSRLFLGTRVSGRFIAGSTVALVGIALLLLREYRYAPPQISTHGSVLLGIALTLVGLLSASASNILQATDEGRRQKMVPLIAWSMLAGTIMDAVFAFATSGMPVFDPSPRYVAGVLYLGVMGSVVTFPLYFGLIREIGAGRAAYSGVAVPVVAMALSTLFEAYRWSGLAAGGAALAVLGLLIALSRPRIATSPSR